MIAKRILDYIQYLLWKVWIRYSDIKILRKVGTGLLGVTDPSIANAWEGMHCWTCCWPLGVSGTVFPFANDTDGQETKENGSTLTCYCILLSNNSCIWYTMCKSKHINILVNKLGCKLMKLNAEWTVLAQSVYEN